MTNTLDSASSEDKKRSRLHRVLRVPSFRGLAASSASASKAKRSNRSKNTRHELILRKELKTLGLKFDCHCGSLPGKPDIVFKRKKLIIFCDGDFWHGRKWKSLESQLRGGSNSKYWIAKIRTNIERDIVVTERLRRNGWQVLRFWESEIKKDPAHVAHWIKRHLY